MRRHVFSLLLKPGATPTRLRHLPSHCTAINEGILIQRVRDHRSICPANIISSISADFTSAGLLNPSLRAVSEHDPSVIESCMAGTEPHIRYGIFLFSTV